MSIPRRTKKAAVPSALPVPQVDEGGLPFNRVLDPADYDHPELRPRVDLLRTFRAQRMGGLFYRNDHLHRDWEYAEVLRKLETFSHPRPGQPWRVLDTGFGCSYFTQLLATLGYDIHASDSEAYGAVREKLIEQCLRLGTRIPLIIAPVEDHGMIPDGHFDVTLCISVIEHIERAHFAKAWQELARVTTPGGYVFITSDYFRDADHWLHSDAHGCQHNPFYPERMPQILTLAQEAGLAMVGTADFAYHGDFVNNYSFLSLTFQKS
jgi:SAM-dependent methyltransferase